MTQAAPKLRTLPTAPDDYLGPGTVVAVEPHQVTCVIREDEQVTARMALSVPYDPSPGDELLLIGRDGGYYVIGVLVGHGKTSLAFHGAVELRAAGGPLTLVSDHGVAIRGPELDIETGRIQVFAESVRQRFGSLYQRVLDGLNLHAGKTHTVVDDSAFTTAKNASIVTEETMTINGKEVHLGH